MSLNALVRDDELHSRTDAERASERVMGLGAIFPAFFSSCYLGVRKPDPGIYEIALDDMQAEPAASLFVDDREENVAGARAVGLRALHAPDPGRLVKYLRDAGVQS